MPRTEREPDPAHDAVGRHGHRARKHSTVTELTAVFPPAADLTARQQCTRVRTAGAHRSRWTEARHLERIGPARDRTRGTVGENLGAQRGRDAPELILVVATPAPGGSVAEQRATEVITERDLLNAMGAISPAHSFLTTSAASPASAAVTASEHATSPDSAMADSDVHTAA